MPTRDASTRFLNVDFELRSRADLTPLIEALAANTVDLNNERQRGWHSVTLELLSGKRTADQAIRTFCKSVLKLPRSLRRLWNESSRRDFDIGIEADKEKQVAVVSTEAVALAARLGAEILVTIYPYDPDNELFK